ncbi:mCG49503, partial [Mus musculus]
QLSLMRLSHSRLNWTTSLSWCLWLAFRRSSHNLSYVDKLTDDVHRPFQDKYLTEIQQQSALSLLTGTCDFQNGFLRLLREAEESSKICAPTTMKKFEDSEKAKKPVRSMIETQGGKTKEKAKKQQQQRRWGGGAKRKVLMALWLQQNIPCRKVRPLRGT